jgi:ribosomal-protein-alanine N-acetyltransferase
MTFSTVEPASVSDIQALREIADECGLSPWSYQSFVNELARDDSIMLLIRDSPGKPIGFIVGRTISAESGAEIYNIGVTKTFRRQGVGKILLDEFLKRARQANAEKVWLEVRSLNAAAIAFYERHGFQISSKRRNFYSNPPDDAILMELDFSIRAAG